MAVRRRRDSQTADDIATLRLVARLQAGDEGAFGRIYSLHAQRIYGYLVAALADPQEAEDAAQEVFLKALGGLERFELRGVPLRVWLFRIARNHVLDRKAARPPVELWDPFIRLTSWLPHSQREVLALRFMVGLSPAETAEVLDVTPATVRNLQLRALSSLRELMTPPGNGSVSRNPARRAAPRRPQPTGYGAYLLRGEALAMRWLRA